MADSVLNIIIKMVKQGGADTETVKGLVGIKTAIMQTAAVAGGLITAGYGIARALNAVISEAAAAEMANAKLAAVLKSTGGAAGMTFDELDKLAVSLSRMSTYDDEAIKGAEALLLTFTSIGKDVFPDTTQAILDMSSALGQDLKASSIQVGKALNDPILGISALRKVGVSFTTSQQKMVKTLVETGRTMDAQKLILAELNKEFGGQAAAALNTYDGRLKQLNNSFGDLKESMGSGLIGPATDLVKILNSMTIAIASMNDETDQTWGDWAADIINSNLPSFLKSATAEVKTQTAAFIDNSVQAEEVAAAMKLINDQNKELLGLVSSLQNIEASFGEQYKTIAEDMSLTDDERKIKLAELAAEHDLDTKKIVLNLLEQKLAQDGLTTDEMNFLLMKGEAWGLYSAQVVSEAQAAMAEVNAMAASINAIPENKTVTITTVMNTTAATTLGGLQNTAGFRAAGGPVSAGSMYMVGEKGPEMFMPGQSGRIIPNGGGGVNVSLSISSPITIMDEQTVKKTLLPFIIDGVRQAQAKGAL